jgi:hypothetical protein
MKIKDRMMNRIMMRLKKLKCFYKYNLNSQRTIVRKILKLSVKFRNFFFFFKLSDKFQNCPRIPRTTDNFKNCPRTIVVRGKLSTNFPRPKLIKA